MGSGLTHTKRIPQMEAASVEPATVTSPLAPTVMPATANPTYVQGLDAHRHGPGCEHLNRALEPVQLSTTEGASGAAAPAEVHAHAASGTSGRSRALPFAQRIQESFGHHDISDVRAFTDGAARKASHAIGADAYTTGRLVAFGKTPDLHTAAHEAAHVVQQRAGVHLSGGVGQDGDAYERHADAVADRVVSGRSTHDLLDQFAPSGGASGRGPVQMAGHAGVMIFGKDVFGSGIILKRVESTEAAQYARVRAQQNDANDPAGAARANGTFPHVYAVHLGQTPRGSIVGRYEKRTKKGNELDDFLAKHAAGDNYIEIASVKDHNAGSVKDFKIGTYTSDPDELVKNGHKGTKAEARAKVAREEITDKLTESRDYGLRDSDQMRSVGGLGVLLGKKLLSSRKFLSTSTLSAVQKEVTEGGVYPLHSLAFTDLDNIEDYITRSDTVYVASSLVMNWASDRSMRDATDSIRLIDLAHPITSDMDDFDEAKEGMLLGIRNLRRILRGEELENQQQDRTPTMTPNPLAGAAN